MIIKSADDTTVLGLISNGSEVVYRDEVQSLLLQPLHEH